MPATYVQSRPQEDLSVVMGRFHAWDAIQKSMATELPSGGVREVSYEEAIAARMARKQVKASAFAPPVSAADRDIQTGEQEVERQSVELLQAILPPAAKTAKSVKAKRGGRSTVQAVERAAVPEAPAKKGIRLKAASDELATGTDLKTRPTARATSTPVKAQGLTRSDAAISTNRATAKRNSKAKEAQPQSCAVKTGPAAKSALREDAQKTSKPAFATSPEETPSFESALAACYKKPARQAHLLQPGAPVAASKSRGRVASVASTAPSDQVEDVTGRAISVNLRLTIPEHARMRAGAAAAGITLAAYIRQATLRSQIANERGNRTVDKPARSIGGENHANNGHANNGRANKDRRSIDGTRSAQTRKVVAEAAVLSDAGLRGNGGGSRSDLVSTDSGLLSRMKSFWFSRRIAVTA